ncbi:alpha/beta hydrolase [uncultured Algibacter sp.]|uniref:alpha/beta fold hydrolase n=1 Tax=uncultured Algibacter sp. TaxID=298659 RepID=UPI00261EB888|nr:alpha/beta hydrolase [uncultured Algibacter sp.]
MKLIKNLVFLVVMSFSFFSNAETNPSFKVDVVGNGDPILLFPGFACTGDVWNEVVEDLSKTNECHIFTFAGFGDVAPIEKPWLPKVKEGVASYISNEHLEEATIIGHSLGGSLGLWLASDEDAKFKKVIVIDALPSIGALMMPNFKSENVKYDNPYNKQSLEMNAEAFGAMATQMASGMTSKEDKQVLIKDWILKADRETYVYGYTDLMKLDLRETIASIKAPVSILAATEPYGEENVKKNFDAQYTNLDNYTIKYAKGSAHFIMYDQPEWLLSSIKAELK